MPISSVAWIMVLGLVATYILLNIYENKLREKDRGVEKDRRQIFHDLHFPEKRIGNDRRTNKLR